VAGKTEQVKGVGLGKKKKRSLFRERKKGKKEKKKKREEVLFLSDGGNASRRKKNSLPVKEVGGKKKFHSHLRKGGKRSIS